MGDRPLHFATAVSMSARFGMDIDVAKMSAEEKAVCRDAVKAYKRIRSLVHLGELYRVESPHQSPRCVVDYVDAEMGRAVVFSYQLKGDQPRAIQVQGLDPNRSYRVSELHRLPGRSPIPQEGQLIAGRHLLDHGIDQPDSAPLQATVIELSAER